MRPTILPMLPLALVVAVAACGTDEPATGVGGGPLSETCFVSSVVGAVVGSGPASSSSASASSTSAAGAGGASSSSASSSAGGGGAAGDGGACGCPGDIAVRSGARLEVLSARSADGASVPVGLYDVEIECSCIPERRPDGVVRCVPAAECGAWSDDEMVEMTVEAGALP